MSAVLIQRLREHLDDGNLLDGYTVRYYRWSDVDLSRTGQVILFRTSGTAGAGAHVVQRPDVTVEILCDPQDVKAGDDRMLQIVQYLRTNFESNTTSGVVVAYNPIGTYIGPKYLQNNRANFLLTVRCLTEDQ